jgi:hypothetical protein
MTQREGVFNRNSFYVKKKKYWQILFAVAEYQTQRLNIRRKCLHKNTKVHNRFCRYSETISIQALSLKSWIRNKDSKCLRVLKIKSSKFKSKSRKAQVWKNLRNLSLRFLCIFSKFINICHCKVITSNRGKLSELKQQQHGYPVKKISC